MPLPMTDREKTLFRLKGVGQKSTPGVEPAKPDPLLGLAESIRELAGRTGPEPVDITPLIVAVERLRAAIEAKRPVDSWEFIVSRDANGGLAKVEAKAHR